MAKLFSDGHVLTREHDELRHRVVARLGISNFPRLRQVTVDVELGVVTLRGWVSSFYERQIAVALAEHVPGVARVVDELSVGSHADPAETAYGFAGRSGGL